MLLLSIPIQMWGLHWVCQAVLILNQWLPIENRNASLKCLISLSHLIWKSCSSERVHDPLLILLRSERPPALQIYKHYGMNKQSQPETMMCTWIYFHRIIVLISPSHIFVLGAWYCWEFSVALKRHISFRYKHKFGSIDTRRLIFLFT